MHAKQYDRTVKPVMFCLWIKPQTNDFDEFIFLVQYFVAIGSFTADGGLLEPTGCVKTTPQKTRCRNVNLYKEFAYKSKLSKWLQRQEIKFDDKKYRAKPNNVRSDQKHLENTWAWA